MRLLIVALNNFDDASKKSVLIQISGLRFSVDLDVCQSNFREMKN